jgi:hypothetical protein
MPFRKAQRGNSNEDDGSGTYVVVRPKFKRKMEFILEMQQKVMNTVGLAAEMNSQMRRAILLRMRLRMMAKELKMTSGPNMSFKRGCFALVLIAYHLLCRLESALQTVVSSIRFRRDLFSLEPLIFMI